MGNRGEKYEIACLRAHRYTGERKDFWMNQFGILRDSGSRLGKADEVDAFIKSTVRTYGHDFDDVMRQLWNKTSDYEDIAEKLATEETVRHNEILDRGIPQKPSKAKGSMI